MKKILFDLFKNRKKHSQGDSKVFAVAAAAVAAAAVADASKIVQTIKLIPICQLHIEQSEETNRIDTPIWRLC